MWILICFQLFVGFTIYIIFANVRKRSLDGKETLIIIAILAFVSMLTIVTINTFAIAAIIVNCAFAVILTLVGYRKNGILPLCAVYGMLTVIIFLLGANITNAVLSFVHIITSGLIPVGIDGIADSTIMAIIYYFLAFIIGYSISKKLGFYLHKRLLPLDETLTKKLSTYILYGAVITLGIFFVHTFLRYAIADFAIITLSYAVTLAISFAYLVFAIFAFADNIRMELELRHKEELLQGLQSYTQRVESVSLELKQFRHDHKNLMLGFHTYVEDQNWDGLQRYYNGYMTEFTASSATKDIFIESLNAIQIPEVKSILLAKCIQAMQQGVDVGVEVRDSIAINDPHAVLDLCRVVGVLLDNAVEACQGVEGAQMRILVTSKENEAHFVLDNTCTSPPPLNEIFNKGFSTKGEGRGLGLYKVSQILDKNNSIKLNIDAKNGRFVQKLIVAV